MSRVTYRCCCKKISYPPDNSFKDKKKNKWTFCFHCSGLIITLLLLIALRVTSRTVKCPEGLIYKTYTKSVTSGDKLKQPLHMCSRVSMCKILHHLPVHPPHPKQRLLQGPFSVSSFPMCPWLYH